MCCIYEHFGAETYKLYVDYSNKIQTLSIQMKHGLMHNNEYIWIDSDGTGGWKVPSGKGQRLIILHAVEGWMDGAELVFTSKTNSADYHDEKNSEYFME